MLASVALWILLKILALASEPADRPVETPKATVAAKRQVARAPCGAASSQRDGTLAKSRSG